MLDPSTIAPEGLRPISRSEYDRLVSMRFFERGERVELLRGALVRMTPQDPPHSSVVDNLTQLLVPVLVGRARVRIQLPLAVSDDSEPEPDVAIVPLGDYSRSHPDRTHLVIEVAVTSQQKDLVVKGRLYAECGVPEYWVVDVAAREVHVHAQPNATGYAVVRRVGPGESLAIAAFADVSVAIAALF